MECYCYLRNVQDLGADGKTPRGRRFGEPFGSSVIQFGVQWLNIVLFLQETSQGYTSLVSFTWSISRTCVDREEFGKDTL